MWSDRWRDCTSSRPWESPSLSTDKSAPRESCRILPKKWRRSGGGKSEGWNPYLWPPKPLASCIFVFHWVMKSWLLLPQITCSSWPEIMAHMACWKMGGEKPAICCILARDWDPLDSWSRYVLCPSRNTIKVVEWCSDAHPTLTHDGSMVLLYGVPWIPSIYPLVN